MRKNVIITTISLVIIIGLVLTFQHIEFIDMIKKMHGG